RAAKPSLPAAAPVAAATPIVLRNERRPRLLVVRSVTAHLRVVVAGDGWRVTVPPPTGRTLRREGDTPVAGGRRVPGAAAKPSCHAGPDLGSVVSVAGSSESVAGRPAPWMRPYVESYVGYRLVGSWRGVHRG